MTKKFQGLLYGTVAIALSAGFVSCSDDNDGPAPVSGVETVFPMGVPESAGGYAIKTNSNGQITEMSDEDETIRFEYGSFSRATNFQVRMTVTDKEDPTDVMTLYLQLNDKGFVQYALETYSDSNDTDEWRFTYNNDGQLLTMLRSEGGNELTTITYTNGDITNVITTDESEDTSDLPSAPYLISYTNSTISTPIDNIGGVMMFDETFGVDMDEMAPAYYAGLLGTATKHLPLVQKHRDTVANFVWTLNDKNLPVKLVSTTVYDSWTESYEYTFAW